MLYQTYSRVLKYSHVMINLSFKFIEVWFLIKQLFA